MCPYSVPQSPSDSETCNMDISHQLQEDWENREFIEVLAESIKNIAKFLNNFDMSCRSRLAKLDEKLTLMEQKMEFIEARVIKGEALS